LPPPVDMEVADTCQATNGTLPVCGMICHYCTSVVPDVCENSFELDVVGGNSVTVPAIGGLLPGGDLTQFTGLIGDDRSINCRIASDWESPCSDVFNTKTPAGHCTFI